MGAFDWLFGSGTKTQTQTGGPPQWAQDASQWLYGRASAASQRPYTPNPNPRVAPFSQSTQTAHSLTNQMPWFNPYTMPSDQAYGTAASISASGAAAPYMGAAGALSAVSAGSGNYDTASGMRGFDAAAPGINEGTKRFTSSVGDYMSPYTAGVVDEVARRGARNLTENLLPGVNRTFTSEGQFGSDKHHEFTNRAVRDANESILGEQRLALESGYKTAGDLFGQDQNRLLTGANLAGNLTQGDARTQIAVGDSRTRAAAIDQENQRRLAEIAAGSANADRSGSLAVGNAYRGAGESDQNYRLKTVGALNAVGTQQQQQDQRNLDVLNEDWNQQNGGWDKSQIGWLNSILSGQNPGTSQTTTTSGSSNPLTMGLGSLLALNQLGGVSGVRGLLGFKRGGHVKGALRKYAEGGFVDDDEDAPAPRAGSAGVIDPRLREAVLPMLLGDLNRARRTEADAENKLGQGDTALRFALKLMSSGKGLIPALGEAGEASLDSEGALNKVRYQIASQRGNRALQSLAQFGRQPAPQRPHQLISLLNAAGIREGTPEFNDAIQKYLTKPSTNVNISDPYGRKAGADLGELDVDQVKKYYQLGDSATGRLRDLDQLDIALEQSPRIGAGAETINQFTSFLETAGLRPMLEGMGVQFTGAPEAIIKSVGSALARQMRQPGEGSVSDFDARMFLDQVPNIGQTMESNLALAAGLRRKAELDRAWSDRVRQLRTEMQDATPAQLLGRIRQEEIKFRESNPFMTEGLRGLIERAKTGTRSIPTETVQPRAGGTGPVIRNVRPVTP